MLPQRQHLRDGRTRTALLAGGSLAGLLVLVLVAHPQLLPWNAGRGPSGDAAAAAALPGPELWAGGEELLVDTDLLQQQRLIESIYQQAEAIQEDELAKLPPGVFDNGIALRHPENAALSLKYLWDFFPASYNCPLREKVGIKHGQDDNGKWVCGLRTLLKRSPCIVYSFGSNGKTSFEQDILRATKCEVHVFDPTLSEEQRKQVAAIHGLTLHDYGLGIKDGQVAVADARQTTGRRLAAGFAVKTLSSIMRELRHEWVDIVKMDVEGAEWAVLEAMVRQKDPLPFTQLLVEYHFYPDSAVSRPPVMLGVLQGLRRRGLRAFSVEPNIWGASSGHDFMEYAYIQVSADGNIVASRRSARRPGAAGALGRLAHAGAGPHAAGLGSHARHAPQPQLVPST